MGILDSIFDSVGGVFADQWKDIITAGPFDEHTVVAPGVRKDEQNGRGGNQGSEDVISNGSLLFVPENTAAFVYSQAGIECIITEPGGFAYRNGELSVFDYESLNKQVAAGLLQTAASRVAFSGLSPQEKRVAFVNLREIRGLKFGTRGPLVYNDQFYGVDLEVFAFGTFSVQVCDPTRFLRSFVPANVIEYSLDDKQAREQMVVELLHSFTVAVNVLSQTCRVSHLPSHADEIVRTIEQGAGNASTWRERFGLQLCAIAVENIEMSDESRELVRRFAERKMNVAAYEDVSQHASDVAAQQAIAEGVRENGLGDGGGMLFGMNLASGLGARNASFAPNAGATGGNAANLDTAEEPPAGSPSKTPSLDEQLEMLKKLKELLDVGVLSQEEFDAKKREVLGL